VLARYQGARLVGFIETKIEDWLELKLNRDKTRIVNLKEEGTSLDFLGFTFRYDRSLYEGGGKYLNLFRSKKAVEREVAAIHELTSSRQAYKPLPDRGDQPTNTGLEPILQVGLSGESLQTNQRDDPDATPSPFEAAQPASL
jgi:hypothetical protein